MIVELVCLSNQVPTLQIILTMALLRIHGSSTVKNKEE
jgi:hypothetical protein